MSPKKRLIHIVLFLFTCNFTCSDIYSQETNLSIAKLNPVSTEEIIDTTSVSIILKSAKELYKENKLDSAYNYFNVAMELAQRIDSKPQIAELNYRIAIYHEDKNNYKSAILFYEQAGDLFNELGKKSKHAKILNFIGYNWLSLYAEDTAIEYYLKSLNIYEEISNNDGIGTNFIDIGNLYYSQENYEYAKSYFNDALKIYETLEDEAGISICYINLGNATADAGDFMGGLDYYKKSLVIEESLNNEDGLAINYNNVGDCYIQLGEYNKAQDYFLQGLEIANKINDKDLMAILYLNISDVQNKLKNFNQAIKYAQMSLAISDEIGSLDYKIDNLLNLTTAYGGLGNKTKELYYLKQYKKVNDSLNQIDKTKKVELFNALNELESTHTQISDLSSKNEIAELKLENEKKITYGLIISMVVFAFFVVILLHQQTSKKKAYNLLSFKNNQIHQMNEKIQLQRDDLKQLNQTKDKFFSIIAHDLKNPFNSIKGFSDLMIENHQDYNDEKKLKFLKIIKGSTSKATSLLNNLLIWANSQSGNLKFRPEKLDLIKYVSDVISVVEIQAINKDILLSNYVSGGIFVNADQNMLKTILRNLISNAIKFTPKNGEVQVQSRIEGNSVVISVVDNGVGIPKTEVKNLFSIDVKNSSVGTDNEQGSGLGLILCKEFVELHEGEIHIDSTEGVGTTVKFALPIWS